MNLALGILAELVGAILLFALIATFNGWRTGKRLEREGINALRVQLRVPAVPNARTSFAISVDDIDMRPGGITVYHSPEERDFIEVHVRALQ